MSRIPIENKYVYTRGHFDLQLPTFYPSALETPVFSIDSFNIASWTPTDPNLLPMVWREQIGLPAQGYRHNQRIGDRIKVSTIRYQAYINVDRRFWAPAIGNPFDDRTHPSDPEVPLSPQIPNFLYSGDTDHLPRSNSWFKFRFMIVEFDLSLMGDNAMTPKKVNEWFTKTFLPYKDYTTTNLHQLPVSVHSNMLHMTTDWTGKFNILFDKKFTIYGSNPVLHIDQTIPINKTFKFDENNTDLLLSPNIYILWFMPRQWATDIDPFTFTMREAAYNEGNPWMSSAKDFFHCKSFFKLNFVDL